MRRMFDFLRGLSLPRRAWTRYALGQRAQIGLACAAERVNVSGLD